MNSFIKKEKKKDLHKKDLIPIPSIDASILMKQISKFECLLYSDTQ